MKAMILVVSPEECCNLLNGDLSLLVRKKFPKDYVGWVYIYCTKTYFVHKNKGKMFPVKHISYSNEISFLPKRFENVDHPLYYDLRGKVVARFWCDKVEEITKIICYDRPYNLYETKSLRCSELLKASCLSAEKLTKYFMFSNLPKESAAIHITKLEIFDKPKEIKEFRKYCDKHFSWRTSKCLDCKAYTPDTDIEDYRNKSKLALTKAPRNGWCYVEV